MNNIIQTHQGPVLFAGDFNVWDLSRQKAISDLAQKNNLESIQFKNDKFIKKFRIYPLDRAFVRGLRPIKAEVIKDIDSSDHKPISFDLEIE